MQLNKVYRAHMFILLWVAGLTCLIAAMLYSPVSARTSGQSAVEGENIFNLQCAACHTIGGGRLVGPDLENVTERRDRDWLGRFIADPAGLIASGDPIANQLLSEYNKLVMPNLGLTPEQVEALLVYLESGRGAVAAAPEPLTGGDPHIGQELFSGKRSLENGGTACLACHHVGGLAALGGGTLGPDLTHVLQRYGDAGLSSALGTLPFPTMQGTFGTRPLTRQEQADLYAFFQDADRQTVEAAAMPAVLFFAFGGLGALALVGLMLLVLPRQPQSAWLRLREMR